MTPLPGPRAPWDQLLWAWRLDQDAPAAILGLARRYGPVCAVGVRPMRYVFLFGPEAHRELFTDIERFSWRGAMKALIPVDGDTAMAVSDGDDHERRRRVVQPAFNIRRIESHLPLMTEEADRTIDRWHEGDVVDAYQDLRACVRRIVIRALFGDRLVGQAEDLGDRLQPALEFVNLPLSRQIRIDLPWTRWHRTKVARRRTDEVLFSEIAHRRAHPHEADADDVLTWLLRSSDLTDQEVRDQVVSLIAAGYDTTSGAAGWTVFAALSHPGVWDRLREEVGDEPLTAERLRQLTYFDCVISESLRLWPPGIVGARQLRQTLEVAGFEVPAGTIVIYSPFVTHRLPEVWPEPERFRPERWDRDTPGYTEPPPLTFLPFGAGPRRCIGFALALLELKAILAELVRRVDLELLVSDPGMTGTAGMRPRAGVPVRVRSVRDPVAAAP